MKESYEIHALVFLDARKNILLVPDLVLLPFLRRLHHQHPFECITAVLKLLTLLFKKVGEIYDCCLYAAHKTLVDDDPFRAVLDIHLTEYALPLVCEGRLSFGLLKIFQQPRKTLLNVSESSCLWRLLIVRGIFCLQLRDCLMECAFVEIVADLAHTTRVCLFACKRHN